MVRIRNASILGRIGTGLGQGISEQLPKEIERSRLASGLKELGEKKDQTPFQQFASLAGIPGITPQMIQSGSELLRQQGMLNSLDSNKKAQPDFSNINNQPLPPSAQQEPTQSITTPEGVEATIKPYIPMTTQQKQQLAIDLHRQNPGLYPDFNTASAAAERIDQENQAINSAKQTQRKGEQDVQNTIRSELDNLRKSSNSKIPDNVYQKLENEALEAVKNGGKDETSASKDVAKKFDAISREYDSVQGLGNWTLPLQNPKEVNRSLSSLREDFKKRNDLENFADTLVGSNGLSYPKAYWTAYDVKDTPVLAKDINSLPKINMTRTEDPEYETNKIAPRLAKAMGKEGSPLAVAEELRMRGYDPNVWLDYVGRNKRELDLSERQVRELSKTSNWLPNLNDLWFFLGSGNKKVIED